MPSQPFESRGLRSRSGIGGGAAVIRDSQLNHAADVAFKAAQHRAYLDQYLIQPKQTHRHKTKAQPMGPNYMGSTGTGTGSGTGTGTTHGYGSSGYGYAPQFTSQTSHVEPEEKHDHAHAEEHTPDCLCTICSCGKHKCPPTPLISHYDPHLQSEHHAQYQPKKSSTQRVTQSFNIPKSVPFQGSSIYQDSFIPHGHTGTRLTRTTAQVHDTGVGRNNAPFMGETTNQSHYRRWNARPAEPAINAHTWSRLPESRDFSSEYRSQHDQKPMERTQSNTEKWQIPATQPFQGESTAHSDYHPHPDGYPSRSFRPHDFRVWLPDNRDFVTENNQHFNHKKSDACPAGPLAKGVTKGHGQHGHIHVERQLNGTWTRSQTL